MTINNLQLTITFPLYEAARGGFRKISICANALFSVIKEEGVAWKNFLLNNSYIHRIYSSGYNATASIAKKIFTPSNPYVPPKIDDSNPSMQALHSKNKAWIQDHSLLRKSRPHLLYSEKSLLDILFSKGSHSKEVIQFARNFCTSTGRDDLTPILADWEKAYERQQWIRNRPQELRNLSSTLAEGIQRLGEDRGRVLLLLEKEAASSTSPLSGLAKKLLEKGRPQHDRLYQNYYQKVKEKLQTYLNTSWKKRCFTEIQEEIRAILLEEYSELHRMGTLKHNLPTFLKPLVSTGDELPSSENNTSLAAVIWDLFLQNGLTDDINQPLSVETLNQIFEKEFTMISEKLERLALSGLNLLIENVGEETQLLLELCGSRLPQKKGGWLEITPTGDDRYCQVNLCRRDTANPRINMILSGEAIAIKKYSYNKVPKHLLQTGFFVDLFANIEGEESLLASEEKLKEFFAEWGSPLESYIQLGHSGLRETGMLDQIQSYCFDREENPREPLEKFFFQMRLQAFLHYCDSVQKNPAISDAALSTLQNSIEFLQAEASRLHETKGISDEEYIETIATTLEVEEYTIKHQKKIQADQEESSTNIIPPLVKEQLQTLFSTLRISELDVENIKSLATVLLGKDMSEEITLVCKELPIASKKIHTYNPPHISLLKLVKTLRIDLGNLRASPISLFKLYSDVNQLLHQSRTLITWLSCIPYLSLLAFYINPVVSLVVVIITASTLATVHSLPYGRAILNIYKAICTFHRETYTYLLMRIVMRLLQVSDIALHWREREPIQKTKFFLTENISNKISFTLQAPLDPISSSTSEQSNPETIPQEIAPLKRFYPYIDVITDHENPCEIRQILFLGSPIGFCVEEQNGARQARLHGQSEFWLAESITDTNLENADFSHLLLQNDQGNQKICIIPRSPRRLFLQTLLRMCNAYSRKSIDLLDDFLLDKLADFCPSLLMDALEEQPSEGPPTIYHYDWVDGELVSQDCNAVGYLITHYLASGEVMRSQRLVDQLKKMKANGEIEDSGAMLRIVEQLSASVPRFLTPDMTKIILELCALCDEIPLQSKAFPWFLRVYQWYVDSKEEDHTSYLTQEEESLLLHHLKDESGEVLSVIKQVTLASSAISFQTLSLLINNIMDATYNISPLGKAGYIPASLKKYELQQNYLNQGGNAISLLLGLAMNNLINPYFSLGKTWINTLKSFYKGEGDFLDLIPSFLFKNTRSDSPKNEQPLLFILPLLLAVLEANKEGKLQLSSTILQSFLSTLQDMVALSITTHSGSIVEEKLSALMQSLFGAPLETSSGNEYGVEKNYPALATRQLIRAGVRTAQNFIETQNTYERQEETENSHWFPVETLPSEYGNLQNLEQNILKRYRDISDTFLEKQDGASGSAPQLSFQEGSSIEDHWTHIVNWHESGRARESNRASYFLNATQSSRDLIHELQQVHAELTEMGASQRKTIEDLLTCPLQELPYLNRQVERYTGEILDGVATAERLQQLMREEYEKESTIKKVGLGFLRYINTLVEVPTFGLVHFAENRQIDIFRKERSELLKQIDLTEVKKEHLFQNMLTAFKPRTSLGFNEVYTYFCQGKDSSIIQSLNVSDHQWGIIKEQLYRYMLLQKYISYAEHIKEIYISRDRTIVENMDLIGYEIDQMNPTIEEIPARDILVRSLLQLEKKLGRTLSPAHRNRVSDKIGASLKNYQVIYQLALSA